MSTETHLWQRYRDLPMANVAQAYLLGVTAAELLVTYADPRLGMALHCLILGGVLVHTLLSREERARAFVVSLMFAPLIRILSLSLPLTQFPMVYWYLIVSVPLFVALWLATRSLGLSWREMGLHLRGLPLQIIIGLSGLLFGTVEYWILRPDPLVPALTWAYLWRPLLILTFSTGLLEEMLFRGVMQHTATESLGRRGIFYVALLFAVLHIGYQSIVDVLFVLAIGLLFAWLVEKTGSLVGVTIAHALTNIMLFLVVPFLGWANPQPLLPGEFPVPPTTPRSVESVFPLLTEPVTRTPVSTSAPTATPAVIATATRTPRPIRTPSPSRTPTPTPTFEPEISAVVAVEWMNFRMEPGLDSEILGHVYAGDEFRLLGRDDSSRWWLVCCWEGNAGWLYASYLTSEGDVEAVPIIEP